VTVLVETRAPIPLPLAHFRVVVVLIVAFPAFLNVAMTCPSPDLTKILASARSIVFVPPTVTVTCFVFVPPQPVAVSVYVVVVLGLTVRALAPEPTSPNPGWIVADLTKGPVLPLVMLPQLRDTDWPAVIEVELALK
jgi:hypothetical protein